MTNANAMNQVDELLFGGMNHTESNQYTESNQWTTFNNTESININEASSQNTEQV